MNEPITYIKDENMRLLALLFLAFLAALAVHDGLGRMTRLVSFVPDKGSLVQQEISVKDVETGRYCKVLRRGERLCQWHMVIVSERGRSLRMFLDPLLEKGDGRYALIQPGDSLQVGLKGDIAYTLARTSSQQPLPGLEPSVTLQDEAQLHRWRSGVVRRESLRLLADIAVLWVAYGFVRRMRFPLRGYLLYFLCTVLVIAISIWSQRPPPLPAAHQLIDQPVTVAALGERLHCRPGWLKPTRGCEPQSFVADMDGRIWPLAYPNALILPLKRGDSVVLGVRNELVYRIKKAVPKRNSEGCRFRDHPLFEKRKVVWMCDDEAERIERARDPILAMISQIGKKLPRIDPQEFGWTEKAYAEAKQQHNWKMLAGAFAPLVAWLFIFLAYLHRGRDTDT
jgi:hypothetical protein